MAQDYDGDIKLSVSLDTENAKKQIKNLKTEFGRILGSSSSSKSVNKEVKEIQQLIDVAETEIKLSEENAENQDAEAQAYEKKRANIHNLTRDLRRINDVNRTGEKIAKGLLSRADIDEIEGSDKLKSFLEDSAELLHELLEETTAITDEEGWDNIDKLLADEDALHRIEELTKKLSDFQVEFESVLNPVNDTAFAKDVAKLHEAKQKAWEDKVAQAQAKWGEQSVEGTNIEETAQQIEEQVQQVEETAQQVEEIVQTAEQIERDAEQATETVAESLNNGSNITEEAIKEVMAKLNEFAGLREEWLQHTIDPEGMNISFDRFEQLKHILEELIVKRRELLASGQASYAIDARIIDVVSSLQRMMVGMSDLHAEEEAMLNNQPTKIQRIIALLKQKFAQHRLNNKEVKKHNHTLTDIIKKFLSLGKISGIAFRDTNKHVKSGLKNLLKYGLGISSLLILFNKLRKVVLEDFKLMGASIPSVRKELNSIINSFNYFKLALGSAFQPIASFVIPYITKLLDYLAKLADFIGQISASLFGQKTYVKAIKQQADAWNDATQAAKGYLSPIDTIHQYTSNNNGGGKGSGAGGVYELANVSDKAQSMADKFKQAIADIQEAIKPFTTALKKLWDEGLSKFANFVWTGLKDWYEHFLIPIGKWAFGEDTGLTRLVNLFNQFLNDIHWDEINKALVDFWDAIAPYATEFGEGLIDFFGEVLDFVRENLINNLPDWLNNLTDALKNGDPEQARKWGKAFAQVVTALFMLKLFSKLGTAITKILELKDAIALLVGVDIGWRVGNGLYELLTGEHIDSSPLEQAKQILDSFTDGTYEDGLKGLGESFSGFFSWLSFSALDFFVEWADNLRIIADLMHFIGAMDDDTYKLFTSTDSIREEADRRRKEYDEKHGYKRSSELNADKYYQMPLIGENKTDEIKLLTERRNELKVLYDSLVEQLGEYDPTKKYSGDEFADVITQIEEVDARLAELGVTQDSVADSSLNMTNTMKTGLGEAETATGSLKTAESGLTSQINTDTNSSVTNMGLLGKSISNVNSPVENLKDSIKLMAENGISNINGMKDTFDTDLSEETFNGYGQNMQTGLVDNGMSVVTTNIGSMKDELFKEENWTMDGVGKGMEASFMGGLDLIKAGWNAFAEWVESHISFDILSGLSPTLAQTIKAAVGSDIKLKIPRLAQGAVIPPNRQFLAMLGDQRSGTNIEAPLDTIKQAMREVLGQRGNGGTTTVNLTLNGRQLAQAVIQEGKVIKATSGNNIFDI